jgi:hypothetical protein
MLQKTNTPGFYKDTETGAIINKNDTDYEKFKAAREEIKKNKQLAVRMNNLETELKDIKSLLLQLVNGNKNV